MGEIAVEEREGSRETMFHYLITLNHRGFKNPEE